MVEDLGKIKITIEGEGAEQVAQDIADSVGESDEVNFGDGATDNGQGGIGGMLGGISTKLAGILAAVGVLASLKPIQEILSGIFRILSVAILPFVSLLNAILQPILLRLTRFIGELDFDSSFQKFFRGLEAIFERIIGQITTGIAENIPGIGGTEADRVVDRGLGFGEQLFNLTVPGAGLGNQLRQRSEDFTPGGIRENLNITLGLFGEQSNSVLKQNSSESNNRETSDNGAGGLFF